MANIEQMDHFDSPKSDLAQAIYSRFPKLLDFEARHRTYELEIPQLKLMADIYKVILTEYQQENYIEKDTRDKPILLHTQDTEFNYVFLPDSVSLNWQANLWVDSVIEHNGMKILKYKTTPEYQKWNFLRQRRIFGGSAWHIDDRENGPIWNSIALPEDFSVADPSLTKDNSKRTIQNIAVGPIAGPFYFDKWEDRSVLIEYNTIDLINYFIWRVRHELAHVDEMNVRTWAGPNDEAFPEYDRLEQYEEILKLRLDPDKKEAILNLHKPYRRWQQLPRGYLGELYGYMTELYYLYKDFENESHTQDNNPAQLLWFLIFDERKRIIEKTNYNRNINIYPNIGKDKYAVSILDALVKHQFGIKKAAEVKKFLIRIKDLMRG